MLAVAIFIAKVGIIIIVVFLYFFYFPDQTFKIHLSK